MINMSESIPTNKLYYSISEVAEMFHVNASLIRYWEKEFPAYIKPRKNRNAKRMFSAKDIEHIGKIHYLLKDQRFTIEGAQNFLKNQKKDINREIHLTHTLKKLKSLLLEIKDELNKAPNA
jgi:DNA-binding transcriptional MerR regulator